MSERVLTVGGNKATRPITEFMVNVATEFYVGPNATGAGDDGRSGRSKETSLATLEAAIALATASKNDVIYLLPGHAETVATAGAISLDKIGLRVIGLGTGALRPTFTFSDTAATITMTAASCVLENVILKPSVDSVVSPLVISGADCKVDIEVQDASSTVECVAGVLTTAGADRLDLKVKYRGFIAGNACVNAIRLVGVDTARIYVDFYGVASTSVVEFHTTACHDIDIDGKFYNNGTSLTKNVVDTVTGSTWSVSGWDGNSNANFTGGDNAAIASDDISALSTAIGVIDGYHDVPTADAVTDTVMRDVVGRKTDAAVTVVATTKSLMGYLKGAVNWLTVGVADAVSNASAADVIGNKTDASVYVPGTTKSISAYSKGTADLQERVAKKAAATMVDAQTMFTIAGGPIEIISLVSVCETLNDATASTLQYNITPTTGAATTISGASASLANAAAGASVSLAGTALATAALLSAGGPNLIANPGTIFCPIGTIDMVVGVGSTTGTWAHYLRYKPLATGVTVS